MLQIVDVDVKVIAEDPETACLHAFGSSSCSAAVAADSAAAMDAAVVEMTAVCGLSSCFAAVADSAAPAVDSAVDAAADVAAPADANKATFTGEACSGRKRGSFKCPRYSLLCRGYFMILQTLYAVGSGSSYHPAVLIRLFLYFCPDAFSTYIPHQFHILHYRR